MAAPRSPNVLIIHEYTISVNACRLKNGKLGSWAYAVYRFSMQGGWHPQVSNPGDQEHHE